MRWSRGSSSGCRDGGSLKLAAGRKECSYSHCMEGSIYTTRKQAEHSKARAMIGCFPVNPLQIINFCIPSLCLWWRITAQCNKVVDHSHVHVEWSKLF